MLIAPQLGSLKWARGQVPTSLGPVMVNATNAEIFKLEVNIPRNAMARIEVPRRAGGRVELDGKPITAIGGSQTFTIGSIEPGSHVIVSR